VALRLPVAVPATVGPLPRNERLREQSDARVVREPEPAGDRERVALLRATAPRQAVDHLDPVAMTLAGEPGEDGLHCREAARLAGLNAELHERHQPPVSPAPFRVDVDAEPAVSTLTLEQRAHLRPVKDVSRLGGCLLVEEVPLRLRHDARLVRREQPADG
jgi:hypothetical protein